jgi:hypothetical protein
MEKLLTLLMQKAYRYYKSTRYQFIRDKFLSNQTKLTNIFTASLENSFLNFAGWEFNYDAFGSTISHRLTYFEDRITIYQHNIYLNRHFLLNLMGYRLPVNHRLSRRFNLEKLVETMAHEVAHCLMREFYLSADEHGEKHTEIKEILEDYLQKEQTVELIKRELR